MHQVRLCTVAPESVPKILTVLLGGSVAVECGVLSGLGPLSLGPLSPGTYHGMHLLLMAAVLALTLALYRDRRGCADSAVPLWFAAGLFFTGVGDYVNSALSSVGPVYLKLSWALVFFALGYGCYIVGFRKGLALLDGGKPVPRAVWGILPVILVLNVMTWISRVQPLLTGHPLLSWGSFAFNATIYVALPWLAIRHLLSRRFSLAAVVVMVGVGLLVYSDLVLFDAWLRLDEGTPIPTALYASNWILYFGGQCLTNGFPSSLAMTLDGERGPTYSVTTP